MRGVAVGLDRRKTHGKSGIAEHRVWKGMLSRCYNKNRQQYENYGAKGIRVCERWRGESGFANFLTDMGLRPSSKHSIDRFPDPNGNYEPGNCRWATAKEQARNRKSNILLEFRGKKQTATEWELELGFPPLCVIQRIRKLGWSAERALTTPLIRPSKPRIKKVMA